MERLGQEPTADPPDANLINWSTDQYKSDSTNGFRNKRHHEQSDDLHVKYSGSMFSSGLPKHSTRFINSFVNERADGFLFHASTDGHEKAW